MRKENEGDYNRLLRVLRRHFETLDPGDLESFLGEGSVVGALLYVPVFCLPLVEIQGMVLQDLQWHGRPKKAVEDVARSLEELGSEVAVEKDRNYMEVYGLFALETGDIDDEDEWVLARFLGMTWKGWLEMHFPGRRFIIEFIDPEESEAGGVGITFYQQRD